ITGALCSLADVLAAQGDPDAASALYWESLGLYRKLPDPAVFRKFGPQRGIACCLEGLAKVAAATGDPERAVRLLGAAEQLRQAIGASPSVPEAAEHGRLVASLQAAQGEAAFATAWAEGQALPLEQTIMCALDEEASTRNPLSSAVASPHHDPVL